MLTQLRSRIQYKIILPFLMLTLLVALAGSAIALLLITANAQERLNNQLAQAARDAGDVIVQAERANLAFLREIAFAPANPYVDAPAVSSPMRPTHSRRGGRPAFSGTCQRLCNRPLG